MEAIKRKQAEYEAKLQSIEFNFSSSHNLFSNHLQSSREDRA